jgi:hypothetical protein
MPRPSETVVIGLAVFIALAGLVIWFLERRKGRSASVMLLLGLPGIYLSALPSVGAPKWLYFPGLTLLATGYAVQALGWRRRPGRPAKTSAPDPSDSEKR